MTSKKLGRLLKNILLFISYHFSKEMIRVFPGRKDLKKYLLIKIFKKFYGCIYRQLKYDRLRIRDTIDISPEITLNAFKCLTVLLVLLKFSIIFVYLSLHLQWICYGTGCVNCTIPSRRIGVLFFLSRHMHTFGSKLLKRFKLFFAIILIC